MALGRAIACSGKFHAAATPVPSTKFHAAATPVPSTKFAVLVAGYGSEYTEREHGGYGAMLVRLLRDPGENWDVFRVVDGIFPAQHQLPRYSGFVVSGSRHDAHANEVWIKRLCELLVDLHQEKKRVLGVCFGHQVLSRALGGTTGRAPVGWEIGLKDVYINDNFRLQPYGKNVPEKLRVLQSHRDQVLELPPGGILLGSSQNTKVEMFCVGDHILGIQGHPEFTKDVLLDIIETRRASDILTMNEASDAKASLAEGEEDDKQTLSELCKSFLKGTIDHRDATTGF